MEAFSKSPDTHLVIYWIDKLKKYHKYVWNDFFKKAFKILITGYYSAKTVKKTIGNFSLKYFPKNNFYTNYTKNIRILNQKFSMAHNEIF